MDYNILISFVVATSVLALSPGPDNIFVTIQSVTHGKSSGMFVVCGLMTGCLVHTSLVAFGLSAVIKSNEIIYWTLKGFGALYMLFLAWSVFETKPMGVHNMGVKNQSKTKFQLFVQGFVMNVLNPKVSLFFLAFFPSFLFSKNLSLLVQFYTLGIVFILTSFVVFSGFVVLSGFLSKYVYESPKIFKKLKPIQILIFVGLSILIILS